MTFGRWLIAIALIAAPGLAQAQEGSGCSGFKWPLDRERGALVRADKPSLPNGGALPYDVAMTLELQPLSAAGLPKAPERAPKSPSAFAGHFALAAPAKAGELQGHDLLGRLGRRPRRRGVPASDRVHGRKGLRRRAQERQVRPAGPTAGASVQRRPARSNLCHRFARPIERFAFGWRRSEGFGLQFLAENQKSS